MVEAATDDVMENMKSMENARDLFEEAGFVVETINGLMGKGRSMKPTIVYPLSEV